MGQSGAGWEAKALYDELRIYSRALSSAEIDLLCSNGAGEMGIRPLVDGTSPFFQVPHLTRCLFLKVTRAFPLQDFCRVK